jgi:transposase
MKMSKRYEISTEQKGEISAARKANKDKRVEARLKVLLLRAEGMSNAEISKETGYHISRISHLISMYRYGGLEAVAGKHYGGNRRNLCFEEEAKLLRPYMDKAEKGQIVEVAEIAAAYEREVGHSIGSAQIYRVLHRQGWRKVMPRSRHPKKASDEVIEASKKLTVNSEN